MNGERLGFTTDLGKTWEMWQIFRELYSNMLDEQSQDDLSPVRARARGTEQTIFSLQEIGFFSAALKKDVKSSSQAKLFPQPISMCNSHRLNSEVYFIGVLRSIRTRKKQRLSLTTSFPPPHLTEDKNPLNTSFYLDDYMSRAIIASDNKEIIKPERQQDSQ